jgi:acetate kinase
MLDNDCVNHILVVNLGSSSGKFSLFLSSHDNRTEGRAIHSASINWNLNGPQDLLPMVASSLQSFIADSGLSGSEAVAAVGHRVVHGGDLYRSSVVITEDVEKHIEEFEKLAPIHNKLNLIGIQSAEHVCGPKTKQVAVFDTAFHRTIPEVASRYPVPYEWLERHQIKRFGFHGISHAYAVEKGSQLLGIEPKDFTGIVCHLGSGCSISAIQNGISIDTSMGFTPLEGLMMGTRSGSIDPGIILELLSTTAQTASSISQALNFESGLSGISGLKNDMVLILEQARQGNARAQLAIDMFVYRLQSFVGSYFVHLKTPRALVFTGGIGENSAIIRQMTARALEGIGCVLDDNLNQNADGDALISPKAASMQVLVIKAREDLYIARETERLVQQI